MQSVQSEHKYIHHPSLVITIILFLSLGMELTFDSFDTKVLMPQNHEHSVALFLLFFTKQKSAHA